MLTVNWNCYHYYQKISKGPGAPVFVEGGRAPVPRHNGTMASPSLHINAPQEDVRPQFVTYLLRFGIAVAVWSAPVMLRGDSSHAGWLLCGGYSWCWSCYGTGTQHMRYATDRFFVAWPLIREISSATAEKSRVAPYRADVIQVPVA